MGPRESNDRRHASGPSSTADSSPGVQPDRNRLLAGVGDALLVFFPALAVVEQWSLPRLARLGEVVSATTRTGFEPLTNYVQFAACALVVGIGFLLGYRRGEPLVLWIARLRLARAGRSRRMGASIGILAATVYFVNVSSVTLDAPLSDGFHEGEYLGFIPALVSGKAVLPSTFLVHGPGVDLLPGLIATTWADPENGIVATRAVYAALRIAAVLASSLAVVALVRLLYADGAPRSRWLPSALALMVFVVALQVYWPDVPTPHKTVNTRDAAYLLQVVMVLVFAQMQKNARPLAALTIAVGAGISLPWAVVYCYDHGLYGAAFLAFASAAFAVCGGRWARTWFTGLGAGAVIGGALVYAVFGAQGVAAMSGQLAFWIRYGRALWAYPGIVALPDSRAGLLLAGAFIALAIAAARMLRAVSGCGSMREAVRSEIGVVVMSAASVSCLRMAIERGDVGHVAWGVTPSWIMLSAFTGAFVADYFRSVRDTSLPEGAGGLADTGAFALAIAVSAVVGCNLLLLNPYAAYDRLVTQYYAALRTTDAEILSPQQTITLETVRDDVRQSSCFYTLTNEGSWYYLLRKPSCSRFYQLTNARPISAQREVVAALAATAPATILFASGGWSSSGIDGVSSFDAHPEVMRYVLTHYRPGKLVADNWFWRRTEEPLRFAGRARGATVDRASEATRGWDLPLTGTYGSELEKAPPKALFVTDGDENAPISANRPDVDEQLRNRWSVRIPTAPLVSGPHRIRVWAFQDETVPMLQLGDDLELEIR